MTRSIRLLFLSALVLVTTPLMADAPQDQYEPFVKAATEIHDVQTSLAWQREQLANLTRKPYAAAQNACTSWGGRLPTVKELLTLVDEAPFKDYEFGSTVDNAIDQNAFRYSTNADQPYWTGTPSNVAGERWGVSFKDGTMVSLKENDATGFYVRCVK